MPDRTALPGNASQSKQIGLSEKLAYAAGDGASALYFKPFVSFLMFFYTDVFGLRIEQVIVMLAVTRTWDWINDPIMGIVCDRTETKHGKFRPWLQWMVVPMGVCGIAVFSVPDLDPGSKLVYAYITYSLAGMAYTAINIPYGASMRVMTPHSDERTTLSSFRFYGAYLGNLLVTSTLLILVAKLGGGDEAAGYQRTMIIYAIIATALFQFTFRGTTERVTPPMSQKRNLKADLKLLVRNRPWLAMIAIGISTILWVAVRDSVVLYYFKYFVGDTVVLTTWFMVLGFVATLLGVSCTSWFTRVLGGKRNCYFALTLGVALSSTIFYFAGPEDIVLIFSVQIAASFLGGPLMPLFWAMIADTADYAEWKYGRRFTGLIFSAGNLSQKLGWTIGPILAGSLLAYYQYEANVEQSPEMLYALKLMISLIPSGIGLLACLIVLTYGISAKLQKQIESELAERKASEV